MTTTHKLIGPLIGGDDWMINVQLVDQDNKPFNIDDIEVKWLLHNPRGQIVSHEAVIQTINAAEGKISIWIPHTETTHFDAGIYTDYIRVVCNNIVSTLLTGNITVIADPWMAEVAETRAVRTSTAEIIVLLDRKERIQRRKDDLVARRNAA